MVSKYERVKLKPNLRLFQYAMIVELQLSDEHEYKPVVRFCVPKQVL